MHLEKDKSAHKLNIYHIKTTFYPNVHEKVIIRWQLTLCFFFGPIATPGETIFHSALKICTDVCP